MILWNGSPFHKIRVINSYVFIVAHLAQKVNTLTPVIAQIRGDYFVNVFTEIFNDIMRKRSYMERKRFYIVTFGLMAISLVLGAIALARGGGIDYKETVVKEKDQVVYDADIERVEVVDKEAETKDTDYFSREGVINGTNVKHSVFAANDNLEFNIAGLDGIAFGAGSTVTVRNSINYGVLAGNSVFVNGTVERDLFAAGNTVSFDKDAAVRDGYVAGQTVVVRGNISGNLFVTGYMVRIEDATIAGELNTVSANIEFGDNVTISGTFKYEESASIKGMNKDNIAEIISYHTYNHDDLAAVLDKISTILVAVVSMAFFVIFVNFIKPKTIEKATSDRNFLSNLGRGFISIIAFPLVGFTLAIYPYTSMIGVLLLAIFILIAIIACAPVVAKVGNLILNKIFKIKKVSIYDATLVGSAIVALLPYVPVVGILAIIIFEIESIGNMVGGTIEDVRDSHVKFTKRIVK